MLPINQILVRLNNTPDLFEQKYKGKKYCEAAMCYEDALLVSRFVEMDTEARDKLMKRFDPDKVLDAFQKAGWYKPEENEQ